MQWSLIASNELFSKGLIMQTDEIHIWKALLKTSEVELDHLLTGLSDDELRRAGRYRFFRDRIRFTLSRHILRSLLSAYTHILPSAIEFSYCRYGKPSLRKGLLPEDNLEFNVSHSGDYALFAFAQNRRIGVDIEFISEDLKDIGFCRSFFSDYELSMLFSLPLGQQRQAFYECWTKKEAFIKAVGIGLSFPLDGFDVSVGNETRLLSLRDKTAGEADDWSVYRIDANPLYAAALVAEGSPSVIRFFEYELSGKAMGMKCKPQK